jgi:hypothetical protein
VVEVDTPSGPPVFVNRWMKTQAISWVSDACLLLDTDTLIRKPLDDLPNLVEHLGAVPNYNTDNPSEQIWEEDLEELRRMDWPVEFAFYANGGALFFNQTSLVKHFFGFWHSFYLESVASLSRNRDQPSLNSAITASSVPLTRLPDRFNFQLHHLTKGWSNALIWHYYSSVGMAGTAFERVVCGAQEFGELELHGMVQDAVSAAHPFVARDELAQAIADFADRNGVLSPARKAWLQAGTVQERLDLLLQIESSAESLANAKDKLMAAQSNLNSMCESLSWRITRPARVVDEHIRRSKWLLRS